MEQSKKRKQSIADSPMAKLCESQMTKKNYLLPACRTVTRMANNLDQYHLKITSNKVPHVIKNLTYTHIYSAARNMLYPYVTENIYPQDPQRDAIHIIANKDEQSTALNITMETPIMNVNFTNVLLNQLASSLLEINPMTSAMDRLGKLALPLYYERKFMILKDARTLPITAISMKMRAFFEQSVRHPNFSKTSLVVVCNPCIIFRHRKLLSK
jgi:alpha-N-acetylglucosamine transferase